MDNHLKGKVEAILFVAGEAVSRKDLAKALQVSDTQLKNVLNQLREDRKSVV